MLEKYLMDNLHELFRKVFKLINVCNVVMREKNKERREIN